MIVCRDCGAITHKGGWNATRCHPCAVTYAVLYKKIKSAENRKKAKRSGRNCSRCGKPTGKAGLCDRCLCYVREWKKVNPALVSAARKKRRHEKRDAGGKLLDYLLKKQGGKCALCGVKATVWHKDHKIPLKLGGCSEPFNMQALCVPCNLSKGAKIIDPHNNPNQLRLVA